MQKGWIVAGAILTTMCAYIVSAQPAPPAAITAKQIRGRGGWKTDGEVTKPTRRWDLQLSRGDDNSILGRITLADSPLATAGNVVGRIEGRKLSGTIADDDGNDIATFEGTLTKTRMSGTYIDRTGEVGSWSWDGPPPQ